MVTKQKITTASEMTTEHLKIDCQNCFGLCCVALHFFKQDGFPMDKEASEPCMHLQQDFRCGKYLQLEEFGYSGCMIFDCFGAGQQVSAITYDGKSWHDSKDKAQIMFRVFHVMRQLHELLWYLFEARSHAVTRPMDEVIIKSIDETLALTNGQPESILSINMDEHRMKVNEVLLQISELVRQEAVGKQTSGKRQIKLPARGADLAGKDLRNIELKGANLRGALLIAANLHGSDLSGTDVIGADMRDTNIKGANLTKSLFLTQAQINAAQGDDTTKLPHYLERPSRWR